MQSSLRFLKADKRLAKVIKKYGLIKPELGRSSDPFQSLGKAIIYQQISGKAAESILKKFVGLFPKVTKIKFQIEFLSQPRTLKNIRKG